MQKVFFSLLVWLHTHKWYHFLLEPFFQIAVYCIWHYAQANNLLCSVCSCNRTEPTLPHSHCLCLQKAEEPHANQRNKYKFINHDISNWNYGVLVRSVCVVQTLGRVGLRWTLAGVYKPRTAHTHSPRRYRLICCFYFDLFKQIFCVVPLFFFFIFLGTRIYSLFIAGLPFFLF